MPVQPLDPTDIITLQIQHHPNGANMQLSCVRVIHAENGILLAQPKTEPIPVSQGVKVLSAYLGELSAQALASIQHQSSLKEANG